MKESCENCRFSKINTFRDKGETHVLSVLCRRHSPSIVDVNDRARWPRVWVDEWCGEWEGIKTDRYNEHR